MDKNTLSYLTIYYTLSDKAVIIIITAWFFMIFAAMGYFYYRKNDGIRYQKIPKAGEVWKYKTGLCVISGIDGKFVYYREVKLKYHIQKVCKVTASYEIKHVERRDIWRHFSKVGFKYAENTNELVDKKSIDL